MTTPTDAFLGPRLAADPAAPLVTHYDLTTGGRIELSGVSTANWAAKVAGLLRDEVGVQPGDEVVLDLPLHWLTPAVLLGAWWAGAHVRTAGAVDPVAVVTVPGRIDRHGTAAETLAMSLDPMGRDLASTGVELPVGVVDLVGACRIHPDAFTPGGAGPVCLDGATPAELGIDAPGGRVLRVDDDTDPVPSLARALAGGASLVLVTSPGDGSGIDAVTDTENVTGRL